MRVARPPLESAETLVHVAGKAGLPILTVADDVNRSFDLLMHDFPHGTLHTRDEFLLVIGLAVFFRPHELHEPRRTYRLAHVGVRIRSVLRFMNSLPMLCRSTFGCSLARCHSILQ